MFVDENVSEMLKSRVLDSLADFISYTDFQELEREFGQNLYYQIFK